MSEALLTAIAMRTERVRLGTCVTPVSRRRPHILAKQVVTLDHLSNGRVVSGFVRGIARRFERRGSGRRIRGRR